MEITVLLIVVGLFGVGAAAALVSLKRKKRHEPTSLEVEVKPSPQTPTTTGGLFDGFAKTRTGILGKVGALFGTRNQALEQAQWEQLEEALLLADVGVSTTTHLLTQLKERVRGAGEMNLRTALVEEGQKLLAGVNHGAISHWPEEKKPRVISIVGVNGVGKTTTIGKLARHFSSTQKKVLLGAGDTFRAAAISQLRVWAERSGCEFVTGREGADPGAVAFDALTAAKARGCDVVVFDTAGRLHTKSNLMEELKKIHRVMKKVIPEAPHETWLVLDGTLGQNSLAQAKEFQKALDLTGLIVTKLDGTAKGGAVLGVAREMQLPIRYIGLGESAEDLLPFEPKAFLEAILGA